MSMTCDSTVLSLTNRNSSGANCAHIMGAHEQFYQLECGCPKPFAPGSGLGRVQARMAAPITGVGAVFLDGESA